jgi:hypothetical protein
MRVNKEAIQFVFYMFYTTGPNDVIALKSESSWTKRQSKVFDRLEKAGLLLVIEKSDTKCVFTFTDLAHDLFEVFEDEVEVNQLAFA